MKVAQINLGLFGSTGRIMCNLRNLLVENGDECLLVYPDYPQNLPGDPSDYRIPGGLVRRVNAILEKTTGLQGCFAFYHTRNLLHRLEEFQPDVVHLHNIHGMKTNYGMLFSWLKKQGIPVVWTLHDCWSFTGHCPHFAMAGCDRWRTGCHHCSQYREYPAVFVDQSRTLWKLKKMWFGSVAHITLVAPSKWLAELVQLSYLGHYPCRIIYNGVDTSLFKPVKSDIRQQYGIGDRKMVLGVAYGWGPRKGLDVFLDLAQKLDEQYCIVLVGTNEQIDQQLPQNIISIHRTQNQQELAEIYTAADVFVNPTREEVLGLVNLEALACGTPVITFRTGGSPECLDATCGVIVDVDDNQEVLEQIKNICTMRPFDQEDCIRRAALFRQEDRFAEYLRLYEEVAANE